MKKFLIFMCVALGLSACHNSKSDVDKTAPTQEGQEEMSDGSEYEKDGRRCIFNSPMTLDSDDGKFHVSITMTPDFNQPSVKNENFNCLYCDNKATLCITSSGDTIALQHYNKNSFMDYVDQSIAPRAIFSRLSCRGFSNDAVKLEAEISVPHSEEECYVTIVVNRDGTISMKRYEDEEVPDEIVGA